MAEPFPLVRHEVRSRTRRRQRLTSPDTRLHLRTSTVDSGVVLISVDGEVDLANRHALAEALASAAADPELRLVVCDLTRVGFLACSGVSVLVEAGADVHARGALLRVVATETAVLRVLDATEQREPLGLRPNLTAALSGFVAPPERPDTAPTLAHLRTALDAAVAQANDLAELCGRLAERVAAVDAGRLVDDRGEHWKPADALADMVEDLRVLQNHLVTGALLAAPAVEDLGHLRDAEPPS
ncbi:anti-sigma factor antagonist [Actinophytocola gossypii]|uniref:Anti-sigma factor antagonist n=1 Tax=Actinophytocola gossypii TaxID=2812003 RepID=A0ABT2J8R7_9PSEU|nr:anti-sigma factor antagonist [Actinophytocola gossypii]MCT2584256.1 anti-sigma factor antagonist [Actinophytocola gossypii]